MSKIESAISWMEKTANDNSHGYDQTHRWGEKGDYDCSAAVITAWENAGVNVKKYGASYTGNLRRAFLKAGFKDVSATVDRQTQTGLKRGDVLLAEGKHVAMYCGAGKEVEASINEKGKAAGGKPGDQTGREFLIRAYRNYPWTHILRFQEVETKNQNEPKKQTYDIDTVAKDVIAGKYGNGDARKKAVEGLGFNYSDVQAKVNELTSKSTVTVKKETKPKNVTMVVVAKKGLRIRKTPSDKDKSNIIKALPQGTKVVHDNQTSGVWYHIVAPITGWMNSEFLGKAK